MMQSSFEMCLADVRHDTIGAKSITTGAYLTASSKFEEL